MVGFLDCGRRVVRGLSGDLEVIGDVVDVVVYSERVEGEFVGCLVYSSR